jgi:hypothetical protein
VSGKGQGQQPVPVPVEDKPTSGDEQPPKDPVPAQADPDDQLVVSPEPDGPVDTEDPNTYPDENAPRGGGPTYTPKGP